jgi:hypothetical protein
MAGTLKQPLTWRKRAQAQTRTELNGREQRVVNPTQNGNRER